MRQKITPCLSRNFHNPDSRYASHAGFAIVPWDNRGSKLLIDWLGRLSVTDAPPKTPTRSASEASSARDWTCIFSITLWRWALIVRAVVPNASAIRLVALTANDKLEEFAARAASVSQCEHEPSPAYFSG